MAQIFDARNNEFQGQLDQIGGGTVTDARSAGATLNAVNGEVIMDLNGKAVATFDIRTAAASLTLVFEGTIDGTNYATLTARPIPGTLLGGTAQTEAVVSSVVITSTAALQVVIGVSGYRRVRCRVSAFTSGTVVVVGRASVADYAIIAQPHPATDSASAISAANTANAALLSIAPGAGRSVYICGLTVDRLNPTATAVAAAITLLASTLTGPSVAMVWSTGNAIAAGVNIRDVDFYPTQPLKCGTGTTVTFGVPAGGAGVQYRANLVYYIM